MLHQSEDLVRIVLGLLQNQISSVMLLSLFDFQSLSIGSGKGNVNFLLTLFAGNLMNIKMRMLVSLIGLKTSLVIIA